MKAELATLQKQKKAAVRKEEYVLAEKLKDQIVKLKKEIEDAKRASSLDADKARLVCT